MTKLTDNTFRMKECLKKNIIAQKNYISQEIVSSMQGMLQLFN